MKKLKHLIKKIWNFKDDKEVDKVASKDILDLGTMGNHVDDFIKLKEKFNKEKR
tara:strand:- start:428 stop:589 length:162 start_codon:yes stop_codon:yes gene_type:complete